MHPDDERYGRELAGQLRRETTDIHAAPDLMRGLRRRHTRRAWTIRTAITMPVAAAVAATFLVTTVGPGAPGGDQTDSVTRPGNSSPARMQNVAHVREQTLQALSQSSRYVIYAKSVHELGYHEVWTDRATQRYRLDAYTTVVDIPSSVAPDGRAVAPPAPTDQKPGPMRLDQSTAVSGSDGDQTIITVDHSRRNWSTGRVRDRRSHDIPDVTDADSIRKAITDGSLELAGEEKVDGHDTLHLRLYEPKRTYRIDVWVDSETYLPVRGAASKTPGDRGDFPPTEKTTYSWLPRTAENLARLTLTPPSGFEHVR